MRKLSASLGSFRRKSAAYIEDVAPERAKRMRQFDRTFFGDDDDDGIFEDHDLLGEQAATHETDFFNGDKYNGETANGKRHGYGVYYYDSGDKYTGQWDQGKQTGHGVYVYVNGDRYVGDWKNGKHHGHGTYYFASGKIFDGDYLNGAPNGHGLFLYTNGEKLDGEWRGSAFPDYGIYHYANGDRYGGSWKGGKKHGIGTYYFGNGAKYQGEYLDGEPNGTAIFIEKDGNAYEEVWVKGRRKERKPIGGITNYPVNKPDDAKETTPMSVGESADISDKIEDTTKAPVEAKAPKAPEPELMLIEDSESTATVTAATPPATTTPATATAPVFATNPANPGPIKLPTPATGFIAPPPSSNQPVVLKQPNVALIDDGEDLLIDDSSDMMKL